jgi:hypothetical protein
MTTEMTTMVQRISGASPDREKSDFKRIGIGREYREYRECRSSGLAAQLQAASTQLLNEL